MPAEELDQLLRGLRASSRTTWRVPIRPRCIAGWRRFSATCSTRFTAFKTTRVQADTTGRPRWPMIVLRSPKGWTGPKEVDGQKTEGHWRSHQVPLSNTRRESRASGATRTVAEELSTRGTVRRTRHASQRAVVARAARRASPRRNAARERRAAVARSASAGHSRACGIGREAGRSRRRIDARDGRYLRDVLNLNAEERNFRIVGPDETASNRLDAVFDVTSRVWMDEILPTDTNLARARPRDGDPQRTHLRRLARRLPANGPTRSLLVLRSVHPHRRLDVQPTREVAEGERGDSVAAADRVAELSADVARVAAGPQRLLASGSGLHRSRREQESERRERLSAAGREHAAVGDRRVSAQPQPRQRHRRGQATRIAVADDGRGAQAMPRRHRHLGVGEQRRRRRTGRGDGMRRRRADARNARGGAAVVGARARHAHTRGQRDRSDDAAAERGTSARISRTTTSTGYSRSTGRSSSRTTAIRG